MKILQIFNRYAYVGGEEIAVGQISAELSTHHEFRAITLDSRDWASRTGWFSRLHQFLAMAWNPESIRLVRNQIKEFQPDLVLLHNIMPIGSAGLYVYLTHRGIPVVQFIHNFRPFSVNGYCWGDGRLLPEGLEKNFLPEILAGAWQESRFKTAWYGLLIWLLHLIGVYKRIDGWIAISQFMKDTFVRCGIDEDRIQVISHGWQPECSDDDPGDRTSEEPEPIFLFLGRLTEEKGLRVLLDAWGLVERASPAGRLMIAGDGPLADEIHQRCRELKRATCLGFKTGEEKKQLLRNCTALVVPSIWWEPLGLVLYEAYDYSKPVLAARSGGIVDHVEDGLTGWLHDPGDAAMLAGQMREAITDRQTCQTRGANGRTLLRRRSTNAWINDFDSFVGRTIQAAGGHDRNIPRDDGRECLNTISKSEPAESPLHLLVYLADQNPGYDRSFGISRMSHVVMEALDAGGQVRIESIASKTSQQAPASAGLSRILPWGTRGKWVRVLTDHFHPLFAQSESSQDIYYFPKGYLPFLSGFCRPTAVTIHDTIIQYDEDHYPRWRKSWEYGYWSMMLKHTLKQADLILTVSEFSKTQIQVFMRRHGIQKKKIIVTYEPCWFERLPQPVEVMKKNYVIHLASCEPHKRTTHLIRWWLEAEQHGRDLPMLHLIGSIPPEATPLLKESQRIVRRPFLEDADLQTAYREAKALILPSEIEGFGLPALEAYYLGTPVCFVVDTSVEEVLRLVTNKGGFSLAQPDSLFAALDAVTAMSPETVRDYGLKLRDTYAAEKVAARIIEAFKELNGAKR